jgi:hypothetical protein
VGKRPKRAFTEEHITALRTKLQTVGSKTDRLMMKFVAHRFAEAKAGEYASQGFARRIQTVRRCIENVFKIVPPNAVRVPSKQRLHDAQINIQAAIANIYGCVDNLAWVWVYERRLSKHIKPRQVGLRKHNVQVRASLSEDFRAYLDTLEKWFEYLADFRHAVAHRVPLYIPPGSVRSKEVEAYNELDRRMAEALNCFRPDEYERLSAEQSKLLVFQPIVGHSFTEMKSPYYFHPQLISDFLTVEELGDKMLAELTRPK